MRSQLAFAAIIAGLVLPPTAAGAQRTDAGRAGIAAQPATATAQPPRADSAGPPISPRRAMLLSLLVPGAAQARLGRTKATYLFGTFELASFFMLEKTAADLRAAKRAKADSVPVYTTDSLGIARITSYTPNRLAVRIPARRTHHEDWIAALIFNHLIAAADAYVAANLWDFKANISGAAGPDGATIGASVSF